MDSSDEFLDKLDLVTSPWMETMSRPASSLVAGNLRSITHYLPRLVTKYHLTAWLLCVPLCALDTLCSYEARERPLPCTSRGRHLQDPALSNTCAGK